MAEFVRVAEAADFTDPGRMLAEVDGEMVAVFHVGGSFYCIDDVCTHDGGPLAEGDLVSHTIACPRHGAKFDIRTGAALSMPAVRPTRAHDVKLEAGGVFVRLRDGAAGPPPGPARRPSAEPAAVVASSAADAVASSNPPPGSSCSDATDADSGLLEQPLGEDVIREILKEVKDPELFVNIVDLGLIYGVTLTPVAIGDAGTQQVSIDMTMTSPACPAGPQLIADTKRAVGRHPGVAGVEVRIVMDPPWTPDRMTDAARDQLGIF
jgi:metal-sulfur cluster biosynthetic enzyme/nitrite reductase/ring-hydroxylating ferredoxin subunit